MFQITMVFCLVLVGVVDLLGVNHNEDVDSPVTKLFSHATGVEQVVNQKLLQTRQEKKVLSAMESQHFTDNEYTTERPYASEGSLHSNLEIQHKRNTTNSQEFKDDNSLKLKRMPGYDEVSLQKDTIPNVHLPPRVHQDQYRNVRSKSSKIHERSIIFKGLRYRQFLKENNTRPLLGNVDAPRRQTQSTDNLSELLLLPPAVSSQYKVEENNFEEESNIFWYNATGTKLFEEMNLFLPWFYHDMKKRATSKVCSPCSSFRDYHKFHEDTCANGKSQCMRCECPNKYYCDLVMVNTASCGGDQCGYGWRDSNCSLSVCSRGYFAPNMNCSLSCDVSTESCHPITGEKMADQQYRVCPRVQSGKNCSEECHCWRGQVCDPVNGDCPDGVCGDMYIGRGCSVLRGSIIEWRSVQVFLIILLSVRFIHILFRIYKSRKTREVTGLLRRWCTG